MVLFGEENAELSTAPFLVKTIEEEENGVRFIVALPIQGKKGTDINDMGNPELNKLLL